MELTGGKPTGIKSRFWHKAGWYWTTGNRRFHGRIKDTFTPVIVDKLSEFDTEVIDHVTWMMMTKGNGQRSWIMIGKGADVVICTGGNEVDPMTRLTAHQKNTGARIVFPTVPRSASGVPCFLAYYEPQWSRGRNPRTSSWDFRAVWMYAKPHHF